jgi:hypothetical protein
LVAAGIWIFVKLPQEYWIHIAQLDFTETVRDYPAFGIAVVAALLGAAYFFISYVRPRLPATDWSWRLAADPIAPAGGNACALRASAAGGSARTPCLGMDSSSPS